MRNHANTFYLENETFATYLRQPFAEAFAEMDYTPVMMRNRMANELFAESIPVILHEDDLNAMYYSIENRSPFLDRHLFEFTASIPTRHLIQNGRAKSVLRESMRGIVPDFILDNPRKVGFNAPLFDYLNVADPQVKAYLLDTSVVYD
jgi:asparagine synthase (glutamine-hydrolysing)